MINESRLSYGVSVTDINADGNNEFIVTGFGYPNLALGYIDGKLKNIIQEDVFLDRDRKTIGVAACDIDKDGFEEIYFLNTDTYSGTKKYSDRIIDKSNNNYFDLFELKKNIENLADFNNKNIEDLWYFYVAKISHLTKKSFKNLQ